MELYPLARKTCDAEARGDPGGREVAVRYPASLGEEVARRFLMTAELYEGEVEDDYRLLRKGLARHLGADLFSRIARRAYLSPPQPRTLWFLLPGEPPALIWRGPPGSAYHFLGVAAAPGGGTGPRSKLAGQVHEIVHWIVQDLLASRRKRLPRWYEEGLCDWAAMHFQRWKNGRWDGGREILARLTWERAEIRRRLLRWPHGGIRGSLDAWRERNWESDLLYAGSLGLQFAVEGELGPSGPVDLLKELLAVSPETDDAARKVMERKVGKPVEEWKGMRGAARQELLAGLLDRARGECTKPAPRPGQVPLAALGHFPDEPTRVIPTLRDLAACPDLAVAAEGITGLRYFGVVAMVQDALDAQRARVGAAGSVRLAGDARWRMADEFTRDPGRAARWFGGGP